MSPDCRKKGKKKVGFWLTDRQNDRLKAVAKAHGMNVSDYLKSTFLDLTEMEEEGEDNTKGKDEKKG